MVVIDAMESLFHAQLITMRASCMIDPGSLVQSGGLNDQRIIIRPLGYRVAEPTWFGIF